MNTFSEIIERKNSRHLVGPVLALCSCVFATPLAFAGGTQLARTEIQPAPDTTPSIQLTLFRPDGPDTQAIWTVLRNGEPLVAFSDDGTAVLSAHQLGGLQKVFLGTEGDSLRFALLMDGKDTGAEAILGPAGDDTSARLTVQDADGNTVVEGTILSELPIFGPDGNQDPSQFIFRWIMWCISRCDRCTDTCSAGTCDNNACGDCFSWGCGDFSSN